MISNVSSSKLTSRPATAIDEKLAMAPIIHSAASPGREPLCGPRTGAAPAASAGSAAPLTPIRWCRGAWR